MKIRSGKNNADLSLYLPVSLLLLAILSLGLGGCAEVAGGPGANSGGKSTPPSVPAGLVGTAISSSQINLSWTASTDNVGVTGYNVYRGGTKIGTNGTTSYSDTGLTASTTYTYTVAAYDAAGNASAQSASVSATTNPAASLAVSMMSPTNGATVSQTVMVSANATDSSGVPSVQFQLDGANIGGSIAVSPYNFSWNTTTTSNGSHTLRAIAKDASGQTSTSSSVTVTVNNSTTDTTPPSVPAGLVGTAISSSQINLSWTASTDNVGVTGYNVYRGGTKIGTSGTTSYSDTGLTASTTYTYTVAAYDAAGNTSAQSASVSAMTQASSGGGSLPTSLGWYQIPNTTYAPLCPSPSPGGATGCQAVVSAWNSGIGDIKRNRLVFWGGGHTDYYGNEIYALDLNALAMLRLDNPSPAGNDIETNPNGTAATRHTYGGLAYITSMDKMFVHGGAVAGNSAVAQEPPAGMASTQTWLMDFPTLISNGPSLTGAGPPIIWSHMNPLNGTNVANDGYNYQSFAAYDPVTDRVYFTDAGADFWQYNPHTNTLTHLDYKYGYGGSNVQMSAAVDYDHHLFLSFGSGQAWSSDLTQSSPTLTQITSNLTGCSGLMNSTYPGIAYDPAQKKLVGWIGGTSVIVFDPAAKTCTTVSYTTGPGAAQSNGTFGRFQYFPTLGVFAVVNDWQQNAWVLRMTAASGTGGSGPVISNVAVNSITTTGAVVTWTTNVTSTTQVEYGTTTGYGNITALNSSLVTSHSQALAALTAGTLYHYRAHSKDSSGVESISGDFTFTTNTQTTSSSVSITAPVANATVSGTTIVSAIASSSVGIASVQFTLDGISLGPAVTASPYHTSWNTATATDGSHLLGASAIDINGSTATANTVSVTVSNATGQGVPFVTRCAAPGVIKCVSFDSDSDMQTGAAGGPDSTNFGGAQTMFPDCNGVYRFARDTSVFAEGVSSLRFDIPGSATCANEAGQYSTFMGGFFAPTNPPGTNGKDLYVQFKAMVDSGWLAQTSGNGRKLIVMEGINPMCGTMTFVQENTFFRGILDSYTDCGGTTMYYPPGATSNIEMEQGDFTSCIYGSDYATNCLNYVPGKWMTFYYHIQLDGWSQTSCYWTNGCTGATVMEAWAAVDPNPLQKWLSIPDFTFKCDSQPNSSCTTNNNDAMSRLTFEVYDTGRNSANNINGTVWYDSIIISTQPISAPYGPTP